MTFTDALQVFLFLILICDGLLGIGIILLLIFQWISTRLRNRELKKRG
jgi:uncharacterized membrane protein